MRKFCAGRAVQTLGGMGYMRGTKCERILHEAKVTMIGSRAEWTMKELAAKRLGAWAEPLWSTPQFHSWLTSLSTAGCSQRSRLAFTERRHGLCCRLADYQLTRALPTHLQSTLPTIEEIEAELQAESNHNAP